MTPEIRTERLRLVPATEATLRAALEGPDALAVALGAEIPPTWPPEYLDDAALRFTLDRLAAGPEHDGWWMHFFLLPREPEVPALIGSGGFAGPPAEGAVEVGYGIVEDRRRQGFASEAVRGLVERAFEDPRVSRVIAQTLPELEGSIGVLKKCGFRFLGEGAEPGVIRFGIERAAADDARV